MNTIPRRARRIAVVASLASSLSLIVSGCGGNGDHEVYTPERARFEIIDQGLGDMARFRFDYMGREFPAARDRNKSVVPALGYSCLRRSLYRPNSSSPNPEDSTNVMFRFSDGTKTMFLSPVGTNVRVIYRRSPSKVVQLTGFTQLDSPLTPVGIDSIKILAGENCPRQPDDKLDPKTPDLALKAPDTVDNPFDFRKP